MSDFSILSATGNKNGAKVDGENRLCTRAVTESENDHKSHEENAYNFNTGAPFDIGANNSSAVAYLKNTDQTYNLIATAFVYNLGIATGASTTGDEFQNLVIVSNPTAISSSTAVVPVNKFVGSSQVLNGTFAKGAAGATFTGGTDMIETLIPSATGGRNFISVGVVTIPPQTAIGIRHDAHTSTTQQYVQFAVSMYLDKS